MRKIIITLLTFSMLLCTGCVEQITEYANTLPKAEKNTENNTIPVAETIVSNTLPFTVSPKEGVEFASMYPDFSYESENDIQTVNDYYKKLNDQFYVMYINMLNSGKYGKVTNTFFDHTNNIYTKNTKNSDHPNFDEYYSKYTYSPIYEFLTEEAFSYDSPSYITPISISDNLFKYFADGFDLQTYQYSNDDGIQMNQRISMYDAFGAHATSYHSYEFKYDIECAVAASIGNCFFTESEQEDLFYTYIINDTDDFFNIYAVYLRFNTENTLCSIGLDYCSWSKDTFMISDVLEKGVSHTPGVISTDDVFVRNGFIETKNNLVKFLGSSLSDKATLNEEIIRSTFDYTAYYIDDSMGDDNFHDLYYHISAWYSLE